MKSFKNNNLDKFSSAELTNDYIKTSKIVKANPKPYEITQNGKTEFIIMSHEYFESMMSLIEDYEDKITILNHKISNSNTYVTVEELFEDIN